jgi:hypothetical protein
LFYRLKNQFDLPSVFVGRRDRRSAERLVIGQENDRFLFIVIPDLDSAEEVTLASVPPDSGRRSLHREARCGSPELSAVRVIRHIEDVDYCVTFFQVSSDANDGLIAGKIAHQSTMRF